MSAKKKSLIPLFGVAFIVAIVSTGVFYGLFVGRLDSATSGKANGTVVVSARALAAGTELKPEDLNAVPWAAEIRPAGAISNKEEAAGKVLALGVAANELLTKSHIGQPDGGSAETGGLGIPDGMRAVSIQVQDSTGVVSMLKPGLRVDVQVVANLNSGTQNEPLIRTVLENMQVLTVPAESPGGRGPQVLTLLATPREAAVLGLADSTAKIRVILRNPIDQRKDNLQAVGLTSVFRTGYVPASTEPASVYVPNPPAVASPNPAPAARPQAPKPVSSAAPPQTRSKNEVQLLVRLAGIGGSADQELTSKLDGSVPNESIQVAAVRADASLDEAWLRWEKEKSIETISSSRLLVSYRMHAGAQWSLNENRYGLRVQFAPISQVGHRVRLRVNPEVTYPNESGVATRRVETEIEVGSGQSFLVKGLVSQPQFPSLWEKLFPGRTPPSGGQGLILVVTPKLAPTV